MYHVQHIVLLRKQLFNYGEKVIKAQENGLDLQLGSKAILRGWKETDPHREVTGCLIAGVTKNPGP